MTNSPRSERVFALAQLPPSLLHFLAGTSAAGAVNLVTQVIGGAAKPLPLVVCALPWGLCAATLMYAGTITEASRREADLVVDPAMGRTERVELYRDALASRGGLPRVRLAILSATAWAAAGIALAIVT